MSDALGLRVKHLFELYWTFDRSEEGGAPDIMRSTRIKPFDGFMNYVRDSMAGYENEEVLALLKELDDLVANEAWDVQHLKTSVNYFWDRDKIWKVNKDKIIVVCEQLCNIRYNSNAEEVNAVVGFDDEIETLLDQLTATSAKQFQIISITGMAGLGKTTLARTLYSHELVKYMFDFRAWTCVSQIYQKKDMLLGILGSFITDLTEEIYEMSENQLGEKLYRKLKGRKYLVVFDDIWDCRVWNDLKMYFPDDKTGSRVLFTSRDIDVSLYVQSARPAHVLRLRTETESWDIFRKKVFRMGIWPGGLEESGRVINRKCDGLPLAIVIAAGLLKNNISVTWWEQVAASLRPLITNDPRQYMDSLNLSYNHLPPHLRPCFLFLGAFPEDYEVPVTKLIWLWIAHGFIYETGSKTMEDVAQDFLIDLIKRSLLMTSKIKSDSQDKTCHIHDLLRDFCLRKADEENFLSNNYRYGMLSSTPCYPLELGKFRQKNSNRHDMLSSTPFYLLKLRRSLQKNSHRYGMLSSKHCYPLELGKSIQEGASVHIGTYKLLKILDLEYICISSFPLDAVQMVNLRYLAIQAHNGSPPASISNLTNLQMLIISSRKNIVVPKTIWNILNLRHLCIKSGENLMEEPVFEQAVGDDGYLHHPSVLASFQTFSQVNPRSCHNIFSMTPNIRKLGFCGPLISSLGDLEFPNLGSLEHLRKLKLLNTFPHPEATRSCNPIMFPENLKNLTLSNTGMDWEEMWTFSLLPNLNILKLKLQACIGELWETGDAEFRRLKVLKLHDLDIKQWVCSRVNFPRLQRLVVHHCLKLDGVPTALGRILTLEAIEVNGCNLSAYNSVVEIQKQQESEGTTS